jgi:hypothetical protein
VGDETNAAAGVTKSAPRGTKPAPDETKPRKFGAVARDLRDRMHGKGALDPADAEDGGRAPGSCFCGGCPLLGGYDVGSTGRAFCQWHAYALPDAWGDITAELQRHRWLIDITGEMQRLWRRGHDAAWRARAETFFADRPELKPAPEERIDWPRYVWRLHETLGFYIGVRERCPQPRERQIDQPQFAARRRGSAAPPLDLGTTEQAE